MDSKYVAFNELDENALRKFAPHGSSRSFPKSSVIVNEGDRTDTLYFVLSGRVKVFFNDEDGKELIINIVEAGDYFGELALDGGARSASVMTLEPCRFYAIPREDIEGLLQECPGLARAFIDRLIGRVRFLTKQVCALALKNVYARLTKFIDDNAVDRDGKRIIPERLTQQDIAARIGGSREMVNRLLSELSAAGYITLDAKHYVIHKKLPDHWSPRERAP